MGRVEEMVVGWDTARGGPAPGPGWQMTPACRPNRSNAGFPVVGEELEEGWSGSSRVIRVANLGELRSVFKSMSSQTG